MDVDPTEIPADAEGDRENPFDPVDPGDDDEGESIPMTSTSRRGYDNPNYQEETSFIDNWDENTPLIQREERRDDAWERINNNHFILPN